MSFPTTSMDATSARSPEKIWKHRLCHVCSQTLADGKPPDKRRCDSHQVGRCIDCEKRYPGSSWCTKCALQKTHGKYNLPLAGAGQLRRSGAENRIPIVHFGRRPHHPSLVVEMSPEGLLQVRGIYFLTHCLSFTIVSLKYMMFMTQMN